MRKEKDFMNMLLTRMVELISNNGSSILQSRKITTEKNKRWFSVLVHR